MGLACALTLRAQAAIDAIAYATRLLAKSMRDLLSGWSERSSNRAGNRRRGQRQIGWAGLPIQRGRAMQLRQGGRYVERLLRNGDECGAPGRAAHGHLEPAVAAAGTIG